MKKTNQLANMAVTVPVTKTEIFGWCMYDVADSAFTTVIVTALYAPFFSQVVAGDAARADLLWGRAAAISEVFVALIVPILGAIADYSGSRKKFLAGCAIIIFCFTASLWFVGPGMITLGLSLYIMANIGFAGGGVFIDSFLPGISTQANAGKISGIKWALGYVSGLFSVVLLTKIFHLAENIVPHPTPEQLHRAQLIPVVVAIYYALAVIPSLLFLRERGQAQALPPGENYFTVALRRIKTTLQQVRQYRELFKLLIAFLIYNDGIVTVIYFAALYASTTLKFSGEEIGTLFITMNVVAALGAFSMGWLADRIGQKKTIFLSLLIWILAVVIAFFAVQKSTFYVAATLVGIGMGSTQSVTRSLLALFTPPAKAAEFAGFLGIAGKALAFLGPLVFGEISHRTGNQRWALLSIGCFFVVGIILLSFVDEQRGKSLNAEART